LRRAWVAKISTQTAAARKRDCVTKVTEQMSRLSDYACQEIGETTMKTVLAGLAFAIALAFASQASALPYCANSTWQHGHYSCANYDE
jgi:peroxiredoxin